MFEWKRKQLENEQVKFFGGTQKKFISCYAKQVKPRIKIKLELIKDSALIDFNPRYALNSSQQMAHQQAIAMANPSSQGQANMINLQAYGAGNLATGIGLAHNALSGGLGAACSSGFGGAVGAASNIFINGARGF